MTGRHVTGESAANPTPALDWLLSPESYGQPPDECCSMSRKCIFATAQPDEYGPNPSDPGEGYYDCALLRIEHVWGESPRCTLGDWQTEARIELGREDASKKS